MNINKASAQMDKVNKLMEIANKLYSSGDYLKCKEIYQALTNKYPNNVDTCLNFSNLMRKLGDLKNALKELERGLSICGSDYRLLCNQGRLLNEMGRQREAISVLLQGISEYEDDSYTWNNLGNSYYELGVTGRIKLYQK